MEHTGSWVQVMYDPVHCRAVVGNAGSGARLPGFTSQLPHLIDLWDFPGGSGVKNLPTNAGTQILSLVQEDSTGCRATKPWSPKALIREATVMRSLHTAARE